MPQPSASLRSGSALALFVLLLLSGFAFPVGTTAKAPVDSAEQGEMPTTGGLRPGPIGIAPDPWEILGVAPVAIEIEKAAVDSQVEIQEIVDGVMLNPSGPFVVAWYRETGKLGAIDNIVMAGHLDYWDVGEAVFWELGDLKKGDVILVTGEDKVVYKYKVDWVKNFQVAELDAKGVSEIVGRTDSEQLTLITCGGPFDYNAGVYLERMVVRASRVQDKA